MTRTDEATDLLESLWHEELRCEAKHLMGDGITPTRLPCSGEARWVRVWCDYFGNLPLAVCDNFYRESLIYGDALVWNQVWRPV